MRWQFVSLLSGIGALVLSGLYFARAAPALDASASPAEPAALKSPKFYRRSAHRIVRSLVLIFCLLLFTVLSHSQPTTAPPPLNSHRWGSVTVFNGLLAYLLYRQENMSQSLLELVTTTR